MADKFDSFAALSKEHLEGRDFSIKMCETQSLAMCVIAPHAGKIEIQTGELATEIAKTEYCYYIFSGTLKSNSRDLHITSHKFDEPRALALLAECKTALGIHGRNDLAKIPDRDITDGETIYLGGLDTEFISTLEVNLTGLGFKCLNSGHRFMAQHSDNVCNRGTTQKGAQLELPLSLRYKLKKDKALRIKFVDAVRAALAQHLKQLA